MELLVDALPYVLPIALAGVTALLSPALATPRRLRQELASDVELVGKLPMRERADLGDDIQRRARHLIAMTRYPTVTLYDLLALLGLTTIFVLVTFGQIIPLSTDPESVLIEPLSLGLPAIFAASCWGAFYVPWATRAKARLEHLRDHLGDVAAQEAARTVRVGFFAALLAGPGAIAIMQLATAVAVHEATDQDWWTTIVASLAGVMGFLLAFVLANRVQLHETLLESDEQHQEMLRLMVEGASKRRGRDQRQRRDTDEG